MFKIIIEIIMRRKALRFPPYAPAVSKALMPPEKESITPKRIENVIMYISCKKENCDSIIPMKLLYIATK